MQQRKNLAWGWENFQAERTVRWPTRGGGKRGAICTASGRARQPSRSFSNPISVPLWNTGDSNRMSFKPLFISVVCLGSFKVPRGKGPYDKTKLLSQTTFLSNLTPLSSLPHACKVMCFLLELIPG